MRKVRLFKYGEMLDSADASMQMCASTVVQTTYAPQIQAAVVGMIADEASSEVGTRQCETAAGIGFGLAVSQGTGDKGAIVGGSAFIGITVRSITLDRLPIDPLSSTEATVDTYPQYSNMSVLSRGHIWVLCGGGGDGGVKANDALFYDTTTGAFSNSASGTSAAGSVTFTAQPNAGDTITINGDVWTFEAYGSAPGHLQSDIGQTLGDTIAALVTNLNASAQTNTETMVYSAFPASPGGRGQGSGANTLTYAYEVVGTNGITVTTTVAGATVNASTAGTSSATAVTGGYWRSSAIAGQIAKVSLGIQR